MVVSRTVLLVVHLPLLSCAHSIFLSYFLVFSLSLSLFRLSMRLTLLEFVCVTLCSQCGARYDA